MPSPQKKPKSEKPFTDLINKKITPKQFRKQTEKPLQNYEKKMEFHEKVDIPEPKSEDYLPQPITDYKATWKEGKERVIIEKQPMQKTRYEYKQSPMRRFITNISEIKIYYDIEKDAYYFYIFSGDRNRILKRIRIDEHDIYTMLAFAIAEIYGQRSLKRKYPDFYITKNLKRKINEILAKQKTIGLEKIVI